MRCAAAAAASWLVSPPGRLCVRAPTVRPGSGGAPSLYVAVASPAAHPPPVLSKSVHPSPDVRHCTERMYYRDKRLLLTILTTVDALSKLHISTTRVRISVPNGALIKPNGCITLSNKGEPDDTLWLEHVRIKKVLLGRKLTEAHPYSLASQCELPVTPFIITIAEACSAGPVPAFSSVVITRR